ncbi:MAG: leucine--tRNA ligase [Candidatus Nezhaarchaeota archaeon]|nr:leucine--tRNA ligase [Candidatus Nezhaarchaeota archaeon]
MYQPPSAELNFKAVEEKWQRRWREARVFEADVEWGRPRRFITVAYPYVNSPQHIGHGRTYTLTDVYARFLRMRGYNVLFPMAFHYTGTPILAMAKRLASKDEELRELFVKVYKVPSRVVETFTDPLSIAKYFHNEIKEGMVEMGYSIDWRREFTTIDPEYSRFIEWQFHKLKEGGFVTKGSHPVGWCPCCGNPVGQHDTLGDVEPEIGQFTLIKFKLDGLVLPAATLRPETVFGVTNLWLKPGVAYVEAVVNGERWLISPSCAEKLKLLNFKVEVVREVSSDGLMGRVALNPATNRLVPILPAGFVDLGNATGVVMSVPAHAPYDLVALRQAAGEVARLGLDPGGLKPIPIIKTPGYGEVPAATVVDREGIVDQGDSRLEEATKELYRAEFHSGTMTEAAYPYSGLSVREARDRVQKDLAERGDAAFMYELLNRPVYCRCGAECVVKVLEDQWFLNYSDPAWKKLAHECVDSMSIIPEGIREEFNYVIDWLREKACARRSGLGTRLPWDPGWIIESLSDSTIYMAYYTIAHVIKKWGLKAEQLSDEVFDYVFLGERSAEEVAARSKVPLEALREMRSQFLYFYPVDSRHSGRDLLWNHLAFMVFNHVAIFPRQHWPRQIVVNGSVLMEGKKMSKSMGNIVPLREAARTYGVDPLRLALISSAELLADADFSPSLARSMEERLRKLYSFTRWVAQLKPGGRLKLVDRWMLSRLQRRIKEVTEALEKLRAREACHLVLYELDKDVQWYMKRRQLELQEPEGLGAVAQVLREVLSVQVRLLAPMAPHVCEELWEMLEGGGFVSTAPWPEPDESKVDAEAELAEELVASVVEDVRSILNVLKAKPTAAYLYVASGWKWRVYRKLAELAEKGADEGLALRELMSIQEFRSMGREAVAFVKKAYPLLLEASSEERAKRSKATLDELSVLKEASGFLEAELGMRVAVFSEEDPSKYDPKGRSSLALPLRPAIYLDVG